jgi:hypothetical protein
VLGKSKFVYTIIALFSTVKGKLKGAWGILLLAILSLGCVGEQTQLNTTESPLPQPTKPSLAEPSTTEPPMTTPPPVTPPPSTPEDFQKFKDIEGLLIQKEINYSIAEQEMRAFLERFPDSPLAGDVQFLLALVTLSKNQRWINNRFEVFGTQESIDELQKLIQDYGERKPHELAVKLFVEMPNWKHSPGGMFPLFSYVYSDFEGFRFWKDFYPQTKDLTETPGAQEIMQTPYAAFAKFALAELYWLAEFGDESWPEHEKRVDLVIGIFEELMEDYPEREIGDMAARRVAWNLGEPAGSNLVKEYLLKNEKQIKKAPIRAKRRLAQLAVSLFPQGTAIKITPEEQEWRILKTNELTSSDDYFYWLSVSTPYPFPPVFASKEIRFVVDETSIANDALPIILEAFQEWEAASEGRIKFIQLHLPPPYPNRAERLQNKYKGLDYFEILVQGFKMEDPTPVMGEVRKQVSSPFPPTGEKFEYPTTSMVDIWLNSVLFDDPRELKAVTLHEIGHALGLDHSYDPNDVMYYAETRKNDRLSNRDITTLKMAYDNYDRWQKEKK